MVAVTTVDSGVCAAAAAGTATCRVGSIVEEYAADKANGRDHCDDMKKSDGALGMLFGSFCEEEKQRIAYQYCHVTAVPGR